MRPEADLSLLGQVRLVAEFLECLDLRDVTLIGNDWGGAQLLVSEGRDGGRAQPRRSSPSSAILGGKSRSAVDGIPLSGARGHATTTILHVKGQLLTNHPRPTGRREEPIPWLTEGEGLLMVHALGEDFALFSESRKYCG
jgi:hypothetical protein